MGIDAPSVVVLPAADRRVVTWLRGLDGVRTADEALAAAATAGMGRQTAAAVLDALRASGALDDADRAAGSLRLVGPAERARLHPDLLAAGPVTFDVRATSRIRVQGTGRVASTVATVLAASGVGAVEVVEPATGRTLSPADCAPAGPAPSQYARDAVEAVSAAVRRTAPSAATSVVGRPDLVVLADASHLRAVDAEPLLIDDVVHLPVTAHLARATVGPLVVPGVTGCLDCLALHRRDRDPHAPRVDLQLAYRRPRPVVPVALATAAAAHAALVVLSWLGRDEPTIAGTAPPPTTPPTGAGAAGVLPAGVLPAGVLPAGVLPDVFTTVLELSTDGTTHSTPAPAHPGCGCRWRQAG
ncbi:MAG: hypothetical protein EPO13_10615 [Actinomycetota bacterium]|nr:MAG: hypothetical protein EPO13_10615 [Actinomycetota bacterium]